MRTWIIEALLLTAVWCGATAQEVTIARKTGPLRGFGVIDFSAHGDAASGEAVFRCESPEKARLTGSKYLTDQLAYGAVSTVTTPAGTGGTVLAVRHGGYWLLGVSGNEFRTRQFPTLAALVAAGIKWEAVKPGAYPRYLDNFDNAGLGIWWMATSKSPEQRRWMKNFPAVVNLHDHRIDQTPAVGVHDRAGTDHALSQIHDTGKPFRHMLWGSSGINGWYGIFAAFPGEHIDLSTPGFTGRRYFEAGGYGAAQVASDLVNSLQIDGMRAVIEARRDNPDLLAWMEPHGEFHITEPVAAPPDAARRFPAFLKEKYTLPDLNRRYGTRYARFEEIPFPDTAYFAGRRGPVVDLDATPWRWQPGVDLAAGEKAGFTRPDFNDSAWFSARRENKHLLINFKHPERVSPLWGRGEVAVPAKFLNGSPVWCYIQPYTEQKGRGISLWVNGAEAGRDQYNPALHYNPQSVFEITPYLKAGANRFAVYSHGGRIAYRMFLSHFAPDKYPFKDRKLNAFFLDWRDYLVREKYLTLKTFLSTLRALDPVRPVKVMTPHLFQSDALDLFEQYGAYPQLTGEGGWFRPMHYKGYGRLRGLPGSSEPGGAQKTAPATQNMFAMIFWESQDCHDYVFDLNRELWSHPEARAWWEKNASLLATLGKTDYIAPKLGELRDLRQDIRYQTGTIWNWDLGRGAFPSLGLTPVLIDGPDLEKKRADNCRVIFDCGTTVTPPAMVEAIRRHVRNGGIFIAQHHTGQHGDLDRDSWPLARSFGLKVTPKWVTLENYHKWPLETIRFTHEQSLFPSLRGRSINGSGVAIDYLDTRRTGGIAIAGRANPVALWADGSMAIAEVPYGKGKFILLGSPFYLRMQDENGHWSNDEDRQKMVVELLNSCGVVRDTGSTDPRVWFEKRASKNGLYDVWIAGALGVRGKWTLDQRLESELTAAVSGPRNAVEPNRTGSPDVPTGYADGKLSFGKAAFSPYQIRQFATIRDGVGARGPAHWLGVQERAWRPLVPGDAKRIEAAKRQTAGFARSLGEEGLDLTGGWTLEVDGKKLDRPGRMGSWEAIGEPDAKRIVYRQTVNIPASWKNARVTLGMTGYWSQGMVGHCKLAINGEPIREPVRGLFQLDISKYAKSGKLALELDVTGPNPGPFAVRGAAGTLYLRKTPLPKQTLELPGSFEVFTRWGDPAPRPGKFPFKASAVGLRFKVAVPESARGRMVRLVLDQPESSRQSRVGGLLIDETGYFRPEDFSPVGPRIDRFLTPGKVNTIELLGMNHLSGNANNLRINGGRLEIY